MPDRSQKIALRYFIQTVGLSFLLCLCFGGLYAYVHESTEAALFRWGFGFLSIALMGVCLSLHAHWLLIRPLHALRSNLRKLDIGVLSSEDLVIYASSTLECEFAEIEELFHDLLQKLQYRHREVLLTKNDFARLNGSLEAELELRRTQLESQVGASFQQNKLNALGEMAAGIAHEINNPLAILVGRTEQLRELLNHEGPKVPKQESILSSMEKTLFRIQEAVMDLELIASSPRHEELRQIPLSRLVKRLIKVVSNRFQTKDIVFELEVEADVELEGREVEMSQALLYLMENAAEAAALMPSEERWVRLKLARDSDSSCHMTVSDSGSGIGHELRGKLFQPFFSTKDEGRGMGLSLAKSVIESHEGHLSFDFGQDNTTLSVRLPLRQKARSVA